MRSRSGMVALALVVLVLVGCRPFQPRVLVVGLDGANWGVLDPLIDAGHLPTIERLVRGGVWADFDCVPSWPEFACFCPPVWTTIATGRTTADHYIPSFHTPSGNRRVAAIWTALAEYAGTSSTLVSWRATWPPESGVEYVVTEPGADQLAGDLYTLWGTMDPHPGLDGPDPLFHPADLPEMIGLMPHSGARPDSWDWQARDRAAMRALSKLASWKATDGPFWHEVGRDLTMITIHSPDKVSHLKWDQIQTAMWAPYDVSPLLDAAAAWTGPVLEPHPDYGEIADFYLEVDRWLGQLLRLRRYDYVVFVSDHGMTRAAPGASVPGHHSRGLDEAHLGIFAIWGPGVRQGVKLDPVTVLDVAPTLAYVLQIAVSEELPGRVIDEAFYYDWSIRNPIETVPSWEE